MTQVASSMQQCKLHGLRAHFFSNKNIHSTDCLPASPAMPKSPRWSNGQPIVSTRVSISAVSNSVEPLSLPLSLELVTLHVPCSLLNYTLVVRKAREADLPSLHHRCCIQGQLEECNVLGVFTRQRRDVSHTLRLCPHHLHGSGDSKDKGKDTATTATKLQGGNDMMMTTVTTAR